VYPASRQQLDHPHHVILKGVNTFCTCHSPCILTTSDKIQYRQDRLNNLLGQFVYIVSSPLLRVCGASYYFKLPNSVSSRDLSKSTHIVLDQFNMSIPHHAKTSSTWKRLFRDSRPGLTAAFKLISSNLVSCFTWRTLTRYLSKLPSAMYSTVFEYPRHHKAAMCFCANHSTSSSLYLLSLSVSLRLSPSPSLPT
jgi:hypothetical protein